MGGLVSGSLCGDCVCALQSFHRELKLDHRKLKVVVPRLKSNNGKKILQPISTVTKLAKALEENPEEEARILNSVGFAPCLLNKYCTGAVEVDRSVKEIIYNAFLPGRNSPHVSCCRNVMTHLHQYRSRTLLGCAGENTAGLCRPVMQADKSQSLNLSCPCE